MISQFTLDDPVPNISDIGLMMGTVTNGLGNTVVLNHVITDFQNDMEFLVECIRNHTPLPQGYSFFVPDLWHVAKGKAKDVPQEESDRLYSAQVYAHWLGNTFLERDYSDVSPFKNNYPGALFKIKSS